MEATKSFDQHFFVLTNGEHIGRRGINRIVETAFADADLVKQEGLYLPGLAGGGVQWQDRYGEVNHPGVSDVELAFLETVPQKIEATLKDFFQQNSSGLKQNHIEEHIQATVLDNKVSPTANLNVFHDVFHDQPIIYAQLQKTMETVNESITARSS